MLNKNLFLGLLIATLVPVIGFLIWVEYLTKYELQQAVDLIVRGSLYSEILSLSAISNLPVFLIFIRKNKFDIARGMLLMTLIFALVVIVLKVL